MPFTTLHVRSIKQMDDGSYKVDVALVASHFPAGLTAPVETPRDDQPVILPAGTKNIDRLDGLHASENELLTWLKETRGGSWEKWDTKEYLLYRLR